MANDPIANAKHSMSTIQGLCDRFLSANGPESEANLRLLDAEWDLLIGLKSYALEEIKKLENQEYRDEIADWEDQAESHFRGSLSGALDRRLGPLRCIEDRLRKIWGGAPDVSPTQRKEALRELIDTLILESEAEDAEKQAWEAAIDSKLKLANLWAKTCLTSQGNDLNEQDRLALVSQISKWDSSDAPVTVRRVAYSAGLGPREMETLLTEITLESISTMEDMLDDAKSRWSKASSLEFSEGCPVQ